MPPAPRASSARGIAPVGPPDPAAPGVPCVLLSSALSGRAGASVPSPVPDRLRPRPPRRRLFLCVPVPSPASSVDASADAADRSSGCASSRWLSGVCSGSLGGATPAPASAGPLTAAPVLGLVARFGGAGSRGTLRDIGDLGASVVFRTLRGIRRRCGRALHDRDLHGCGDAAPATPWTHRHRRARGPPPSSLRLWRLLGGGRRPPPGGRLLGDGCPAPRRPARAARVRQAAPRSAPATPLFGSSGARSGARVAGSPVG